MVRSLLNELASLYGINLPIESDDDNFSLKFNNDVEIHIYPSKDKNIIHMFSLIHEINGSENKLNILEYVLKLQLLGVRSRNNSFGLSDDGRRIYIYRNIDINNISPEAYIEAVKDLSISSEHTRREVRELYMDPQLFTEDQSNNHFCNFV